MVLRLGRPKESVALAAGTAGSAVIVAGTTVIIATGILVTLMLPATDPRPSPEPAFAHACSAGEPPIPSTWVN
ncbi:hypothetical protein [Streptomyces sp. NBC_01483]|uniref:hypothetical protein n=1 Tax=Streptomyces sp. NBC_01483 TaxID=2903883 RepID=UPI002E335FA0|nr:hypothetical protein [Streptomyces sp. NBC_01483]